MFSLAKYLQQQAIALNKLKKKAIKNPLKKVVNAVLKRTFDILFSGFILVFFLSWMFPLFALIIKLQSQGQSFINN
jgi:lipopolysaccharide/colanic/teichoic acid biosynthesis glycosyltransferase